MAMSLWDHEQRLRDLELALQALTEIVCADPAARRELDRAVQSLRSAGARGAAEVLSSPVARAYAR